MHPIIINKILQLSIENYYTKYPYSICGCLFVDVKKAKTYFSYSKNEKNKMSFVFFAFVWQQFITLKVIRYYTEASAASAAQEHNSSGPCLFVSAPGLLSEIEESKEGESRFVLQSVSFVRVDMEEGVKQLDKMALMCLKNLLSLIKAHTHARQKQTEQNQFSTASTERPSSPLLLAPAPESESGFLCLCNIFFFSLCSSYRSIASSLKDRTPWRSSIQHTNFVML